MRFVAHLEQAQLSGSSHHRMQLFARAGASFRQMMEVGSCESQSFHPLSLSHLLSTLHDVDIF